MQEYFNISLENHTMEEISALCGPKDAYVDLLCREFQTSFVMRGNELKIRKIDAESEGMVRLVVARLLELVEAQGEHQRTRCHLPVQAGADRTAGAL